MPGTINKVEDPCQVCRDRHLKCDDTLPRCSQCVRLGEKCQRAGGKLKFRHGSSAKYDTSFQKDQTWLNQSKHAKIQFVDQGPELENYYAPETAEDLNKTTTRPESLSRANSTNSSKANTAFHISTNITSPASQKSPPPKDRSVADLTIRSPASAPDLSFRLPLKRPAADDPPSVTTESRINSAWSPPDYDSLKFAYRVYASPRTSSSYEWDGMMFSEEQNNVPKVVEAEYRRLADSAAGAIPPETMLTPAIWKEQFYWPNQFTTTQCACLMRYYIEQVAPWFDAGDPARNFALVVPQRARRCPPLLNAIFTAAARRLANLKRYRDPDGVIRYEGIALPKLNTETAIRYHNAALAYLTKLSGDPDHVRDENLLATAVILRYYEELDVSITGEDTEMFLGVFQIFVNAQARPPYDVTLSPTRAELWRPQSSDGEIRHTVVAYLKSFSNACFRIALRQEVMVAFLKQRPIYLNLDMWPVLRSFDEAEDVVWSDRHLYHCANVLQFCFGADTHPIRTQTERWNELKNFETQWEQNKPLSFSPIHYNEANIQLGEILPSIWYMADVHVSAMQYFELARIMLTVYNPSIPRLGPGATAAQRRMSQEVREIVIRLCGVAKSAPITQPALVQAYMAIAICGEHFNNRQEQQALLEILRILETDHGWPTNKTANELKNEWNW